MGKKQRIKKMRVLDVIIFPNETVPVTQIVSRKGYEITRQMKAAKGFILPDFETIVKKSWGAEYLYTTDQYFEIIAFVEINDELFELKFKFDETWITDLASVPKAVRSIIDDNAPWIIPACQPHDGIFTKQGCNFFDFRATNRLFYEMCNWSIRNYSWKLNWFKRRWYYLKSKKAWLAVNTFVGRKRWKSKRENWEKQGFSFEYRKVA